MTCEGWLQRVSNPSSPDQTPSLAPPRVSVIVALYNRLDLTQEFHATLPRTLPADLVWELIYVDDGTLFSKVIPNLAAVRG